MFNNYERTEQGAGWLADPRDGTYINDVHIRARLVRLVVFRVFQENFVHVGRCVLKEPIVAVEDHQSYFAAAQHRQLVGLLHQAELALGERHLPGSLVVDSRDVDLLPAHDFLARLI